MLDPPDISADDFRPGKSVIPRILRPWKIPMENPSSQCKIQTKVGLMSTPTREQHNSSQKGMPYLPVPFWGNKRCLVVSNFWKKYQLRMFTLWFSWFAFSLVKTKYKHWRTGTWLVKIIIGSKNFFVLLLLFKILNRSFIRMFKFHA